MTQLPARGVDRDLVEVTHKYGKTYHRLGNVMRKSAPYRGVPGAARVAVEFLVRGAGARIGVQPEGGPVAETSKLGEEIRQIKNQLANFRTDWNAIRQSLSNRFDFDFPSILPSSLE